MSSYATDTVVVICDVETEAARIMSRFYEAGISAIGPVATAGLALALVAQAQPTLALIASPPTGRRNAQELARTLKHTWNIGSVILGAVDPASDAEWAPRPNQLARVSAALGGLEMAAGRPA